MTSLPPHWIGARWPTGTIPLVVEAGEYRAAFLEAMQTWNIYLVPLKRRFVVARRTRRNPAMPLMGDKESAVHITSNTSFYADCDVRRIGGRIIEADVRLNPKKLTGIPHLRLVLIFIHELGHALGFHHYDGPELSVMHEKLPFTVAGIMPFDIRALQTGYAIPPKPKPRQKK